MLRVIGNDQNLPRQEHATTSGAITNGTAVVANSDGTVGAAAETVSFLEGTAVNFSSQFDGGVGYDSTNNKIVVAWADESNNAYGSARVGTIDPSDNSVSFGSTTVFESAGVKVKHGSIAHDVANNKIVIVYKDEGNSNYGTAVVGTISGTSISFGTPVVYSSGSNVVSNTATYSPTDEKILITYRIGGLGKAIVGTVSGTSISFGSEVQYNSSASSVSVAYITTAGKFCVYYKASGSYPSGQTEARIATISGTSVSFGSANQISHTADAANNQPNYGRAVYDTKNDKMIFTWNESGDGSHAVVGTVSGTSISTGTVVNFDGESTTTDMGVVFDENVGKVFISYRASVSGTNLRKFIIGTVSGTSISFNTEDDFGPNVGSASKHTTVYDSGSKRVVIAYDDQENSEIGYVTVFTLGGTAQNLTSENYIGIARSGAASGAGIIVDTQGAIADIPVINYVLSNASYDNVRFNSSSQDGRMSGIAFNTDGTKMYLVGTDNDSVYQYSLSTAFNVSTASYDSVSFSVSSQSVFPSAIEFNNDGTKMFIGSSNTNGVFQYSLSSGFDLSTASYDSVSFDPSTQETNVQGIQFNNDGTKMYIIGTANNTVFQYSLSTAFNLSTASYDSVSFSVASQNTTAQGLEFNNDGTKLFVVDNEPTEEVYQYDLTTGFDISTASYSNIKLDVSSQDSGTYGISFNADGTKMYLAGQDTDYIYQYSTAGSSLTPGQSYYVQTDGTLGTTAATPSVFAGTAVSATELIVKG